MNKKIPNGSTCLFRKNVTGSRDGKIVLVENHDFQDPDFNSAFTIKKYSSQKSVTDEGWSHNSIVLKPLSTEKHFKDIVLTEENSAEMNIVGEFIAVLE